MTTDISQQRISDLEAMNAELKAEKERLYALLETAQANLAREQEIRSLHVGTHNETTPAPAPAGKAATRRPQEQSEFQLDSWERLKRWFFNA